MKKWDPWLSSGRFSIYDQTYAAQVVADDLVGLARANHGAGAVRFVGVDVEGFEIAVFVGVGDGAQSVLVNQAVLPLAVFAFAYIILWNK